MSKYMIALCVLLAGTACGEDFLYEPDPAAAIHDFSISSDGGVYVDSSISFWTQPECPEDFRPITITMPPEWKYGFVEIECGRIVSTPAEGGIERE